MLDGTYFFECACGADEHTIRFVLNKEDEPAEIYLSIFLDPGPWWKRLGRGIKYILGYKCKYGHFGNWTMDPEDVSRLKKMITDFEIG